MAKKPRTRARTRALIRAFDGMYEQVKRAHEAGKKTKGVRRFFPKDK